MLVYLTQSVVSGFHFVVPDFWVLWALAIAIPSLPKVPPRISSCGLVPSPYRRTDWVGDR